MTSETEANVEVAPKPSALGALMVYLERRSLVMLALGFSAGLPNLLIFDTLSVWLREAGLSLEVIGFFSLATLAYSLKFIWAPLVDRTTIPILSRFLGHRRSWMLAMQALVILGLWLIAGTNPAADLEGATAVRRVHVAEALIYRRVGPATEQPMALQSFSSTI